MASPSVRGEIGSRVGATFRGSCAARAARSPERRTGVTWIHATRRAGAPCANRMVSAQLLSLARLGLDAAGIDFGLRRQQESLLRSILPPLRRPDLADRPDRRHGVLKSAGAPADLGLVIAGVDVDFTSFSFVASMSSGRSLNEKALGGATAYETGCATFGAAQTPR